MQINAYRESTKINTEVNERPLNIGTHWNIRHHWFQRVPISSSLAQQHFSNLNNFLTWYKGNAFSAALAPCIRDAQIPFFNIRILSVSVKNYPYPIRSDVDNWYPYPIRIRGSTMVQYDTVSHPKSSKCQRRKSWVQMTSLMTHDWFVLVMSR